MKFGKDFSSQQVPEWEEDYMDYNVLKTVLQDIIRSYVRSAHPHNTGKNHHIPGSNRSLTLYSAFIDLPSTSRGQSTTSPHDVEAVHLTTTSPTGPIIVNTSATQGYETKFLMAEEEGGECELVFFRRLDDEFNKVDRFYKKKVEEVMNEAMMLNKQMDALIASRLKVEHPDGLGWEEHTAVDIPNSAPIDVIEEEGHTELNFSGENLRNVEEKLKQAFNEFNQKLRLLKSYSFLNVLAFSKILKMYDKLTSRNATTPYMKVVDSSSFGNSDEVMRLMEQVEATLINHFANGNRTKGMSILTPKAKQERRGLTSKAKQERHGLTFATGFSAGCVVSLLVALAAIIQTRNIFQEEGHRQYMDTMFPLYSLFGFIVLHIIMYAGNIYYWRHYRVNYCFLFGFKQGTELGCRQVLLIGFSIGVLALLCIVANLDMEANPMTKDYKAITELLPLILLIALFIVLLLPFNVFYFSSRVFFLSSLFRLLAAPFYKVRLPDFFLGDQLTSQVQALRSIEFYVCYYGWGEFKQRENTCNQSAAYNALFFIIGVIPYCSRLLQCLRLRFEEKITFQGYNGIKHFLTIVAVCLRTAYSINKGLVWRTLAAFFSAVAAIFCIYWDFVYDWGLLNRTSKNRWLRDILLIPEKKIYYIAMVFNLLLRFAWIQRVVDFDIPFMHRQTMVAVVASLEIIRRGVWNFFRLENEYLIRKYRAETVETSLEPSPFKYEEEEEDKDD